MEGREVGGEEEGGEGEWDWTSNGQPSYEHSPFLPS